MDRKDFLKQMAGLTSGIVLTGSRLMEHQEPRKDRWGTLLPTRKLGSTGEEVTMLGVGGYHIGGAMSEKEAQKTIETAIAGGIRFFDTAESYQNGGSEKRYGKYLVPKYRDDIFLMSKTYSRDAETTRKHLEGTLRRLNTDHLDLWQVHSLQSREDVDNRIENGVLDVVRHAKETGKARHIGFTGHASPYAHMRMLEKTRFFETCQMPVNVLDPSYHSFIHNVMPILTDRNMGILAMKTLADGRFFSSKKRVGWSTDEPVVPDRISIREALYFAWSLPISVLITGADDSDMLQEKIDLAKNFKAFDEQKRQQLIEKVADLSDGSVEYFKNV